MKNYFTFLFITVFPFMYLFAQIEERAIGKVEYEIKRAYLSKTDSTTSSSDNRSYFTQRHSMYFGQNSSLDINQTGGQTKLTLKDGDTARTITEKDIQENPELKRFFSDRLNSGTPQRSNLLYRVYDQPTLTSLRSYTDLWTIDQEVLPVIDWQLTGEIKELEGLSLHKAKGTFKGRNYIAWYCKDIPVPVGPWKLHGLPGLIVEAYDDTNEIEFRMVELEIPLTKSFTIAIPEPNGKIVSKEEFDKQVRNKTDQSIRMQRAMGGSGAKNIETKEVTIASLEKN